MSVRAKFDAWKGGATSTEVRRGARRVPRSHAREKKKNRGRRIDARRQKGREKNILAGAKKGAGEKKKYYSGGSEKKFWRQREHNPQKDLRTVEKTFSIYLFLSGVSTILEGAETIGFFWKVNAKDKNSL